MSSPLQLIYNAWQWIYNESSYLLFPNQATTIYNHHQILLTTTIGIGSIIATDFAFGYARFLDGNALVERRIPNINNRSLAKTKIYVALKQSSTTEVQFSSASNQLFKSPMFLRHKLSFNDWLFQYFYGTRLNLYTNIAFRCIDHYFLNYSKRRNPTLNILGKLLIESPTFLTFIDPPKLQRHKYLLSKLGVESNENIIFFSDNNIRIPYQNNTEFIEFIEICCEITADNQCIALFWRLKGTKLGYIEMCDADDTSFNIEQFMVIIILWLLLKAHSLCHGYGEKIILKKPKNVHLNKNKEMKRIYDDLRRAEVSMTALNHVARMSYGGFGDNIFRMDIQEIVDENSLYMVWKHGAMLHNELLSRLRIPNFLLMARKKLSRLFTINGLHKYYDFEATFLCICVHGIDHYCVGNNSKYLKVSSPKIMAIPDIEKLITFYIPQNEPILRESRLKYLAKSKMLKQFSAYLDLIDTELSNSVNLINSG